MKSNINALPRLPNCYLFLLTTVNHFYCDCYSLWKEKRRFIMEIICTYHVCYSRYCSPLAEVDSNRWVWISLRQAAVGAPLYPWSQCPVVNPGPKKMVPLLMH